MRKVCHSRESGNPQFGSLSEPTARKSWGPIKTHAALPQCCSAAFGDDKTLRLIDVNFNRAKEGLRVCEDILRFVYNHKTLTQSFKKLRHDCSKILIEFPVPYRNLVKARNSAGDVGKESVILEKKKPDWEDLLISNMKRSEEALRVLEEASKIIAPAKSRRFQQLRFRLYELEKKTLRQF